MTSELTRLLRCSLLCLLLAWPAFSQGTDLGIVRGTITDVSGAVVPKAGVEITDLATNAVRKLTTDSKGNYEAAGLKYGDYKVTVTAAGFSNVEITGISLRAGDIVRADARLKPAGASVTVVITAEARRSRPRARRSAPRSTISRSPNCRVTAATSIASFT